VLSCYLKGAINWLWATRAFCIGFSFLSGTDLCLQAAELPAYAAGEVIVQFKQGVSEVSAQADLKDRELELGRRLNQRAGKSNQRPLIGLVRDSDLSTEDLIRSLSDHPNVAYVEPNYRREALSSPDDTSYGLLWGLENSGQTVNGSSGTSGADIQFEEGWKYARSDSNEIVIGVVDTGVDVTHPDLAANIWVNPNEIADNGIDDDGNGYIDDLNGYSFSNQDNDVSDSGEHGTHVAGTIAAVGYNATGVIGVCYPAKILPLRISDDAGDMYTSDFIEALEYAIALKESGVNIVALNASLGGDSFSTAESEAIDALEDAGIILCAAAGNDGDDLETDPIYPAAYDNANILCVAAIDQDNELASFSNYGATLVDLAAPGVNIYSTMPSELVAVSTSIQSGGVLYEASELEYSGTTETGELSGTVYDCGLGEADDFPAAVDGNIALILRGDIYFSVKVQNAMDAGAIAAIIYDNVTESFEAIAWTLSTDEDWIPALGITLADGEALLAALPVVATLENSADLAEAYQYMSGTSMATPYVSGAVGFAAWNFPDDSMLERMDRILNNVGVVDSLSGQCVSGGVLNLYNIVDSDADTLPDWWELDFFDSLSRSSDTDSDKDGYTDEDEFILGTDPTLVSRYSGISEIAYSDGAGFSFSFETLSGRSYNILWSETLESDSWAVLESNISGDGTSVEVLDSNSTSTGKSFYKLEVSLE
jgi:subtilisin family serine protease